VVFTFKGDSETHKWKKEVEEDWTEWNKECN